MRSGEEGEEEAEELNKRKAITDYTGSLVVRGDPSVCRH